MANKLLSMDLFRKYGLQVFIIVALFVGIGLGSAYMIKPTYKVSSIISISPSYFQNSLMREFLSEIYDPTELRSQRQSIMTEVLNQNFLDEISQSVGLTTENETAEQASLRRMLLSRSIEIVSLQSTDFQISVMNNNRDQAMKINQMVIDNILTILKEKRTQTLSNLREAIAAQIQSIVPSQKADFQSLTPDSLKIRIANLQKELTQQKTIFSDSHPAIQAKIKKLNELNALYENIKNSDIDSLSYADMGGDVSAAKTTQNTVYDDLVRKYRYLNIVLLAESTPTPSYFRVVKTPEYPLAAVWPKKTLFLVWSLMLGALVSLAYVGIREFLAYQNFKETKESQQKTQQQQYLMKDTDFIETESKVKNNTVTSNQHDIQP